MDPASRGSPAGPAPSLGELTRTFLAISLAGFGGPSAHLALMLDEIVERKRWLSRERFLELVAITNLLPGPNSSEVAIHIGHTQRGWPGALATGLAFLVPTFLMVTALSALYFRFGALPQVAPLFWGLQPVIVAIVLSAGVKIARAGVRDGVQGVLAASGVGVSLASGEAIIGMMLAGGALTWWLGGGRPGRRAAVLLFPLGLGGAGLGPVASVFAAHLWMGCVLFGGGYVLVALLEPYAVGQNGWLTATQFLDGVALTQAVPGPISTLSAFVGYAAAGVPGALAGTLGIYLPAFAAVLFSAPRLDRLRRHQEVRDALDGVVAVAAGAVFGVGLTLVLSGVRDPAAAAVAIVALTLALWRRTPSIWLVAGGLAVGAVRVLLV